MAVRTHQLVAVQEQVAHHHVRQAVLAVQNVPSRNRRLVACYMERGLVMRQSHLIRQGT